MPIQDPAQKPPAIEVDIDGAVVAHGLGLGVEAFRTLMAQGRIKVLCERGTGADEGLYRASFYYGNTRVRMIVHPDGRIVPGSFSAGPMPRAGRAGKARE